MLTTAPRLPLLLMALLALCSFSTSAAAIPIAADWTTSNTIITNRNSPTPTMGVTDIAGGVALDYNAPTGGLNVGTSTRQYDFLTTATETGIQLFDISIEAINGTFNNTLTVSILRNSAVVSTLVSTTANTFNQTFLGESLSLNVGDSWGIRATAGNFSLSTGTSATIGVTAVPEPGTALLMGLGLVGLGAARRRTV